MTPSVRRLALTAHVTFSVGWLGSVVVFLGLAIVGLTSPVGETVRGAYLVMEPMGRWILLPLAVGSLVTGLIQALGTRWGLIRHYWVVFKLLLNLVASAVLLMYTQTFASMAAVAGDPSASLETVRNPSPLIHGAGAWLLLLTATVLSIYKPRGTTPFHRDG